MALEENMSANSGPNSVVLNRSAAAHNIVMGAASFHIHRSLDMF